ncbi:ankyrin repeat domain-containing protein [uncultured Polaribacter sp.]|uniref:ankyrin repeat domain-containing protein n=1 Tax=uncultured Polaribacter sp. TaxID=174711 RepID=UPI002744B300|nr:ankyrin repeat domain-containing protein [Polaribacter sp.]|tara:strand:- start:3355 stop:3741 length:387 start_codon:yes stop_codon:yes gene_type:complete
MKKLILPMFLFFFAFSTVNATNNDDETKEVKSEITLVYNVNAFCKLIQMGDYDAVKALIKTGENVNAKSNGLTPLMFAARHNKAKIAKLLIDNGAKLKTKSDTGNMTALDMAKRSKAIDAIKVIKEAL